MRYVMHFCTRLVWTFARVAPDDGAANRYSVLATSLIFEQVARTKGYTAFGTVAKLREDRQHVSEAVLAEWIENVELDVGGTLDQWHPRVTADNVQPLYTHRLHPTCFHPSISLHNPSSKNTYGPHYRR